MGRAPTATRTELAEEALELPDVVNISEMTTGTDNLHIVADAVDSDAADDTIAGIGNLDLEIKSNVQGGTKWGDGRSIR